MFSRFIKIAVLSIMVAALSACGFHLRKSATLPANMRRIHLAMGGNTDLQRVLARVLRYSGAIIEPNSGPGIIELRVPVAMFTTNTLSVGSAAQVTEYSVHLNVQFAVDHADSTPLVKLQNIQMSREYSYDATNPIGNATQIEQIQLSLNNDMAQAILFRLQAAGKRLGGFGSHQQVQAYSRLPDLTHQ